MPAAEVKLIMVLELLASTLSQPCHFQEGFGDDVCASDVYFLGQFSPFSLIHCIES